jgi:glycosyltransferase involved in cell wall biosynthesis
MAVTAVTTSSSDASSTVTISVVIPCLDEAETIAECVTSARAVLDENGLSGEVVVVDNGSTDGSGQLARAAGARVVDEPRRGYGSAFPKYRVIQNKKRGCAQKRSLNDYRLSQEKVNFMFSCITVSLTGGAKA